MMKTILLALMASMAVAFSPVALPNNKVSTTSLNGGAEAAAQVLGWIALAGIGGAKLGGGEAGKNSSYRSGSAAPAAAAAAPAFDGDISIPYDAAAKLAYEKAGSPGDYAAFKTKYEADAVAAVKAKQ